MGIRGRAFPLRVFKFYLSLLFSKYEIVIECKPQKYIFCLFVFSPREIVNPIFQKVLELDMSFLKDNIYK